MQNTAEITFSSWPHSQLLSYLFSLLLIPFNYYADYIKLQIILCINSRWSVFLSFPLTSHISHQTRTTIVDASCRFNRFKKRLLLSIIDICLFVGVFVTQPYKRCGPMFEWQTLHIFSVCYEQSKPKPMLAWHECLWIFCLAYDARLSCFSLVSSFCPLGSRTLYLPIPYIKGVMHS